MRKGFDKTYGRPGRKAAVDLAEAETIAIAALGFLAEQPQRIARFMQLTGLTLAELTEQAGAAHLQAALLDHVLGDETLLLVFTTEKRLDPDRIAPAQALLAATAAGG